MEIIYGKTGVGKSTKLIEQFLNSDSKSVFISSEYGIDFIGKIAHNNLQMTLEELNSKTDEKTFFHLETQSPKHISELIAQYLAQGFKEFYIDGMATVMLGSKISIHSILSAEEYYQSSFIFTVQSNQSDELNFNNSPLQSLKNKIKFTHIKNNN